MKAQKYDWKENQGSWNADGLIFGLSVDVIDDEVTAGTWATVGGSFLDPPDVEDVDSKTFLVPEPGAIPALVNIGKEWCEAQDMLAYAHETLANIEIEESFAQEAAERGFDE